MITIARLIYKLFHLDFTKSYESAILFPLEDEGTEALGLNHLQELQSWLEWKPGFKSRKSGLRIYSERLCYPAFIRDFEFLCFRII